MTARSKAYTRIGCLPDCWSDRTLRPVRRAEAPIGCTGDVRGVSASGGSVVRRGLRPRNLEILAAPPAGHAARPSRERLTLTAAGANGIPVAAALREVHSIARPGDHGPPARRSLDDLQQRGRDLEEAATDLEHRLKRIEPRDTVPRPAAELHVPVGPQASPHPSHRVTSVRLALHCFAKATRYVKPPGGSRGRRTLTAP